MTAKNLHYNPNPEIHIDISDGEEGFLVKIQDNGIGMSKKEQAFIFDKFYRSKNTLDPKKGFGLGLAYVKMIMDLHKGMIEVFSELNKGTRFELCFLKI